MFQFIKNTVLCLWVLLLVAGCQVTEEKIEVWKSTKSGPQKLSETIADVDIDNQLRAKAVVALAEIKEHGLINSTLEKMKDGDADQVIGATIPLLSVLMSVSADDPAAILQSQVTAKDGLYLLYDYAGDENKKKIAGAMVKWCSEGDFNMRARAGAFTVKAITTKMGAAVASGLADLLTIEQVAIEPIAKMIRAYGDASVKKKASAQIAGELANNMGKFSEAHLTAAAIIGGDAVGDFLIRLAADNKINAELQRFALRAYSLSLEQDNIKPTDGQVSKLIAVASNESFDKFHREEIYMTLAQVELPKSEAALLGTLRAEDFFWRLVGIRCLLRQNGQKHLAGLLKSKGLAKGKDEIAQIIDVVGRFPELKGEMLKVAGSAHAFARGVAVFALGKIGLDEKETMALKGLANKNQRLPKGFDASSVGKAVNKITK